MMFARPQQAVAAATFIQNSGWSLKTFLQLEKRIKKYLLFKDKQFCYESILSKLIT